MSEIFIQSILFCLLLLWKYIFVQYIHLSLKKLEVKFMAWQLSWCFHTPQMIDRIRIAGVEVYSLQLSIFKYCLRPREHFWQALRVRVMKKKKIKE